MVSGDGRHVIVFNGEIYNFLELRRELEAQGAIFRSQSDTEVILAAWQAWQEGMLTRFKECGRWRSSTQRPKNCFWRATASASSRYCMR